MTHNQPAFPTDIGFSQDGAVQFDSSPGMSLRDWFAGQALAGYCAVEAAWDQSPEEVARCSYRIADAMLEAGSQP